MWAGGRARRRVGGIRAKCSRVSWCRQLSCRRSLRRRQRACRAFWAATRPSYAASGSSNARISSVLISQRDSFSIRRKGAISGLPTCNPITMRPSVPPATTLLRPCHGSRRVRALPLHAGLRWQGRMLDAGASGCDVPWLERHSRDRHPRRRSNIDERPVRVSDCCAGVRRLGPDAQAWRPLPADHARALDPTRWRQLGPLAVSRSHDPGPLLSLPAGYRRRPRRPTAMPQPPIPRRPARRTSPAPR